MKAASISELKQELQHLDKKTLIDCVLRLSKFKKDSKELLTYILFESGNERSYIASVKEELETMFAAIPGGHNLYFKHKMVRKILRTTNKYIRYSDHETTKVELLIHFCKLLREYIPDKSDRLALENLYESTLAKIHIAIGKLHEDLQNDYLMEISE